MSLKNEFEQDVRDVHDLVEQNKSKPSLEQYQS